MHLVHAVPPLVQLEQKTESVSKQAIVVSSEH